jgi:outer membrane protein assembly factor BamB
MFEKSICLCVACLCVVSLLPVVPAVVSDAGPRAGGRSAGIVWRYDLAAPSFGSSAVGDIDADGRLEIVFGTYFHDEHIYALNAEDGSLLWSFDTGGCNDASAAIADVDMDGSMEVVVPASSPCIVYCFDGATGAVEWSRNTGHCLDSPPAVADVDMDGKPEVIVGAFEGYIFCLAGEDGSVQWQKNVGTNSYIETCPTLVDVDNDSGLDVVVGQWQGDCRVYALDGVDGSQLWYSGVPTDWMYHGASCGDVDEDGRMELVIGCYDNHVYVLNCEDGSLCWSYAASGYVGAPTSLADLNNDGHLEVVFVAGTQVGVLSHTGSKLWSMSVGGDVFRGVAIGDVDGDGVLDLAFGCSDGKLRVVRGDTGAGVWTVDLQADYGSAFPMDHAPVLADLNGDGMLEVFVVGGHGESTHPENNYGRAYVVSAGVGTGPGWPMFHHDLLHSGRFHVENLPPSGGNVSGSGMGRPDVNYTFCVVVADSEGDLISVVWDFGDGTQSGWLGPYPSGSACCVQHAWAVEGVYELRVKLRDDQGSESGWSDPFPFIVDGSAPVLSLVSPAAGHLYLGNVVAVPFPGTVVIGSFVVQAQASDTLSGVERVEFLVDGGLVATDSGAPYAFRWGHERFGRHVLAVGGYDRVGNWGVSGNLSVWKLW